MARDNRKFWDRVAKMYTPIQEKGNAKMYAKVISDIEGYMDKDMRVLELAMGTGQFTFSLCDKVAYYEATDFSEKMLSEAKNIHSDGIVYSVQDATNLTYEDGSFDMVIIANALHIMPEPDKALAEIHRVLVDGGLLVAPTFTYDGNVKKFRLWLLERVGFKVYHKWISSDYASFIDDKGFETILNKLYPSKLGPECLIVSKKITKNK